MRDAVLSLKFGVLREPASGFISFDARPVAVKNALPYTLTRLANDETKMAMLDSEK